jgi:lysozyme
MIMVMKMEIEMNSLMKQNLKCLLTLHEGRKNRVYLDTRNNITAGIGHNLSAHDIEEDIIERWFEQDSGYFYNRLAEHFYWFKSLNEARQIALVDMCFMGFIALLSFVEMIKCFEKGDFDGAADEILNSDYALELPKRAHDIAHIIKTGSLIGVLPS